MPPSKIGHYHYVIEGHGKIQWSYKYSAYSRVTFESVKKEEPS